MSADRRPIKPAWIKRRERQQRREEESAAAATRVILPVLVQQLGNQRAWLRALLGCVRAAGEEKIKPSFALVLVDMLERAMRQAGG